MAPTVQTRDRERLVLQARGLTKDFTGFLAVNNVDLDILEGTIHALIGPNGAGKTTLFNLLTKFVKPTAGQIIHRGRDITGFSPVEVVRLGLVRSFQISAVFPHLSVLDNVRIALQRPRRLAVQFWKSDAVLRSLDDRARELLDAVGLDLFSQATAGALPYGRKRALELATTLALEPDVMLLDEPFAGIAHEEIPQIVDLVRRVATGRTIIMVEHNLSVVAALCDRVTVLQRGEVIAQGTYDEVTQHPAVRVAYLGSDDDA